MVVEAPGLFTTTTGCPSGPSAAFAKARELTSVLPPGGHGTIRVIGRSGNGAWACAGMPDTKAAQAVAARVISVANVRPIFFLLVVMSGASSPHSTRHRTRISQRA